MYIDPKEGEEVAPNEEVSHEEATIEDGPHEETSTVEPPAEGAEEKAE